MGRNCLQRNQPVQYNQFHIVITLLHNQLNVALGSRLEGQRKMKNGWEGERDRESIVCSSLPCLRKKADLHGGWGGGEGDQCPRCLVADCRARGVEEVVDAADEARTLTRVGIAHLCRGQ